MSTGLLRASLFYEVDADIESELHKAAEDAIAVVAGELTARFNDAISGEYWPWPDSTPRWGSTGAKTLADAIDNWHTWLEGSGTGKRPQSVAGSPRSIVDSGQLKQSLNFELDRKGLEARWTWNEDYAAAVHEGAYIHPFQNPDKVVQIPARPWTLAVIEGGTNAVGLPVYPVAKRLAEEVTLALGR
jgi:hypothetical protein